MPGSGTGHTFAFVMKKKVHKRMTGPFTPDEDAILGEILGTNNYDLSDGRIKDLSTRCNMSYERTVKAIASLYKKGALDLPDLEEAHHSFRTKQENR
jgi:hypothetical protein